MISVLRDALRLTLVGMIGLALAACLGMPEGVEPVTDFEAERYLGRWYEIARLDHSFERDLIRVSAEYSRNTDGSIRVLNRGYDVAEQAWSDIEGKAKFVEEETRAYLKVSFFGPFYGSYVVFELERDDYTYAYVSGYNNNYLWLLAREKSVGKDVKDAFVARAAQLGFDTNELIWVDQSEP